MHADRISKLQGKPPKRSKGCGLGCYCALLLPARSAMSDAEVPKEVKAQLLKVFSMLDRNGSLQIDLKEVGHLMNKLLGFNKDEMAISEIMTEICDSDAPGSAIDFEAFCKALGPVIAAASEEELNKRAFEAMDSDGSKCISATELAPLMSNVAGSRITEKEVDQVLEISAGKDGKIRYEDYVRAVTQ